MPLFFKTSSSKGAFFWFFFVSNCVQFYGNRKDIFIEFTSFESLFSVKFQGSVLDQSHHLFVNVSCKSAWENLDATSARSAACL